MLSPIITMPIKRFNNNKLPKWKINKIKNRRKAPNPRSKGKSKMNDVILGLDSYYLVEKQSGEVYDNEMIGPLLDTLSHLTSGEINDVIRSLSGVHVLLSRGFGPADMDNAEELGLLYYALHMDERFSLWLDNTVRVCLSMSDEELLSYVSDNLGRMLSRFVVRCVDCDDSDTVIESQGGFVSTEAGIPVNVNVNSSQLQQMIGNVGDADFVTKIKSLVTDLNPPPLHIEHSLTNPLKGFDLFKFISENKIVISIVILSYVGYCAVKIGGRYETFFNIAISLAAIYVVSDPFSAWIKDLIEIVKDEIRMKNQIVPQGGIAGHLSSAISRLALGGLLVSHCTGLKADTASGIVSEFMGKMSNMKRVGEGLTFTIDFLFQLVQDFLNWFTNLSNVEKITFKDDPFWEISLYGEKVHKAKQDYISNPLKDSTFAGELSQLRADGEALRSKYHATSQNFSVMSTLSIHLKELNDLICELNSKLVSVNGVREEPFMLLLLGKTEIGKTTFTNVLVQEMTAATLETERLPHFCEHPGEYIHLYNAADAYYSGYHGQYNLIADEFGYMKDVANGMSSVFTELIQWINVNPMNLPMADLNSKGRVYFRSKCVWATSNRKHFSAIDSVVEREAVYRRLAFTWIAAVKQEFATETTKHLGPWERCPDWHKVNYVGASDDFSYLEFYKMKELATGEYHNEPISVTALKDLIMEEIERKKTNYVDLKSKIKIGIERALKARDCVVPQAGENCGACVGCDKNLFQQDSETRHAYCQRLFKLLSNNKEVLSIGYTQIDFPTFMDIYSYMSIQGHHALSFPPLSCVKEATSIDTLVAFLVSNSERNRAAFKFKNPSTFMGTMWSWAKTLLKSLLIASPLIGVLHFAKKWLFSSERMEQQHGDYPTRKPSKSKGKAKKMSRVVIQGGDDPNAQNIIVKLVNRNVWRFSVQVAPNKTYTGCVLCVQNNMALTPEHYISRWMDLVNGDEEAGIEPQPELTITFSNHSVRNPLTKEMKRHEFTISLSDLLNSYNDDGQKTMQIFKIGDVETDDIGLIYIPGMTGRKISHLIRSRKQKLPTQHKGVLGLVNRDLAAVYHTANYRIKENVNYAEGDWTISRALVYDIPTRVGDCGAPFVIFDKSSEQKIASIHVVGLGNVQGIGIVIDREGVESAISTCCSYYDLLVDVAEEGASEAVKALIQGGYDVEENGPVFESKVKPIPQAKKTKIIPSPIHNLISIYPPKKKPAMLNKQRGLDPMRIAMFGYGISHVRPRMDLYRAAIDNYCDELFNTTYVITDELRRSLTFEEMVMGIPGEEFIDGINRKTSPGWPMKLLLTNGSKKSAFGSEEYTFVGRDYELVKEHCDFVEGMIIAGKRPYILNNHFLKDELRTIEKSNQGKTRLISSTDLVFSLLLRKYTLMFSAFMMRTRIHNGSACGMNPYGSDWNVLALRHGNGKPNYRLIAGDHSGYDKSLAPCDIQIMKVVTLRFYQDQGSVSEKIRNALIDEIAQSRHVVDGRVYSWAGGNTSGNALTTPIDTIAGCVLDRYVILLNFPKPIGDYNEAIHILSEMSNYVKITRYNDDVLMSVQTNGPFQFLTQNYMTEAFAKVGMVFTDENKDEGVDDLERTLTDVTFLKRYFAKTHYSEKRRWMAPIVLDTICESIQWSKDHDVGWEFWKNNVDHMLMELSAHPKSVFKLYSEEIIKACSKCELNHTIVLPSYRDLQDKFICTELYY